MNRWVVYLDKAGKWRFRLVAENGETVSASESYESKEGAIKGIQSIIDAVNKNALVEIQEDLF